MAKKKKESLAGSLLHTPEHLADRTPKDIEPAMLFCEGYKSFLDSGKTERECNKTALEMLKKAGYKEMQCQKKYKAGDKIYYQNRGKALVAATVGSEALESGVRITAAHADSPRLDLKPNPLYEADELAYFKTHYYGGIRKYQWGTIPLSMHGVVVKKDGELVEVCLGEEAGEPVFTITDLLPHLSANQNKRPLSEGLKGEELNILVGSYPMADKEEKTRFKLEVMRLLNEKYGIVERDFTRAEIEFVPAHKACDIGFDKSMLGAYGQDDRVCCYTALMAELDVKKPKHTTVFVMADKEEVGSDGVTGLAGDFLFHFLQNLAEGQGAHYNTMLASSQCLSADVHAAFDPNFADVYDKKNTVYLNQGAAFSKYGGARGKSGTSDAGAEFMGIITCLLDEKDIPWQLGELGRIDIGGGGTVAKFIAGRNIDTVDIGVPVLSMHSPFEVTAKMDVYNTYQVLKAFLGAV